MNTFLLRDQRRNGDIFAVIPVSTCTSLYTSSTGPNLFKHLKQGPQLFTSPSRLWPCHGLLWHLGEKCVWMDTFPGCSLIDASVETRGLMLSCSCSLAFSADPACRLIPLWHAGWERCSQTVWCHAVVVKRFKGCFHPTGLLRGKTVLDKALDLKEKFSSLSRSQDWCKWTMYFFFFTSFFLSFPHASIF